MTHKIISLMAQLMRIFFDLSEMNKEFFNPKKERGIRMNRMGCIVVFLTVVFFVVPSAKGGDYDVGFVDKVVKDVNIKVDITDDLLEVEVVPGFAMKDILIPLCVAYKTSEHLRSSNRIVFKSWLEDHGLHKNWLWVLNNWKNYENISEFSKVVEDLSESEKTKSDIETALNRLKTIKEISGDDFSSLSPTNFAIGQLEKLIMEEAKGTTGAEIIKGVKNLVTICNSIAAPTPLGAILLLLNASSIIDNMDYLVDAVNGKVDMRYAYLLYYIGDEISKDKDKDGNLIWSKAPWNQNITCKATNYQCESGTLVDMMMRMASSRSESVFSWIWFKNDIYTIAYPYSGGYEYEDKNDIISSVHSDPTYHHCGDCYTIPMSGYIGEGSLKCANSCYNKLIKSTLEIGKGSSYLERVDDSEFYRSWSRILFESSDNIKRAEIYLRNLASIFSYYQSIEEGSYGTYGNSLEDALTSVVVSYRDGYEEIELKDVGKLNDYLDNMERHFENQIENAFYNVGGIAQIGRGIGFSFLDDSDRLEFILNKMKEAYDSQVSIYESRLIGKPKYFSISCGTSDQKQCLATPVNHDGWVQYFQAIKDNQLSTGMLDENIIGEFAVYFDRDGGSDGKGAAFVVTDDNDFLRIYEEMRNELGMPTGNRTGDRQNFENGYIDLSGVYGYTDLSGVDINDSASHSESDSEHIDVVTENDPSSNSEADSTKSGLVFKEFSLKKPIKMGEPVEFSLRFSGAIDDIPLIIRVENEWHQAGVNVSPTKVKDNGWADFKIDPVHFNGYGLYHVYCRKTGDDIQLWHGRFVVDREPVSDVDTKRLLKQFAPIVHFGDRTKSQASESNPWRYYDEQEHFLPIDMRDMITDYVNDLGNQYHISAGYLISDIQGAETEHFLIGGGIISSIGDIAKYNHADFKYGITKPHSWTVTDSGCLHASPLLADKCKIIEYEEEILEFPGLNDSPYISEITSHIDLDSKIYATAYEHKGYLFLQYLFWYPFDPKNGKTFISEHFSRHSGDVEHIVVVVKKSDMKPQGIMFFHHIPEQKFYFYGDNAFRLGSLLTTSLYSKNDNPAEIVGSWNVSGENFAGSYVQWPQVVKTDEQPHVYIAMGSHGAYFREGTYTVNIPETGDTRKNDLIEYAGGQEGINYEDRLVYLPRLSEIDMVGENKEYSFALFSGEAAQTEVQNNPLKAPPEIPFYPYYGNPNVWMSVHMNCFSSSDSFNPRNDIADWLKDSEYGISIKITSEHEGKVYKPTDEIELNIEVKNKAGEAKVSLYSSTYDGLSDFFGWDEGDDLSAYPELVQEWTLNLDDFYSVSDAEAIKNGMTGADKKIGTGTFLLTLPEDALDNWNKRFHVIIESDDGLKSNGTGFFCVRDFSSDTPPGKIIFDPLVFVEQARDDKPIIRWANKTPDNPEHLRIELRKEGVDQPWAVKENVMNFSARCTTVLSVPGHLHGEDFYFAAYPNDGDEELGRSNLFPLSGKGAFTYPPMLPDTGADEYIYVTITSGPWNDPATWKDGMIPPNGENVNVEIHHNVELDRNMTVGTLTIHEGATLQNKYRYVLQVTGTFVNNGQVISNTPCVIVRNEEGDPQASEEITSPVIPGHITITSAHKDREYPSDQTIRTDFSTNAQEEIEICLNKSDGSQWCCKADPESGTFYFPIPQDCIRGDDFWLSAHAGDASDTTDRFSVQAVIQSTPEGGDWDDPNTWIGNCLPAHTDVVRIANGAVVTGKGEIYIKSLVVETGSTLTHAEGYEFTITIFGALAFNGNVHIDILALARLHGASDEDMAEIMREIAENGKWNTTAHTVHGGRSASGTSSSSSHYTSREPTDYQLPPAEEDHRIQLYKYGKGKVICKGGIMQEGENQIDMEKGERMDISIIPDADHAAAIWVDHVAIGPEDADSVFQRSGISVVKVEFVRVIPDPDAYIRLEFPEPAEHGEMGDRVFGWNDAVEFTWRSDKIDYVKYSLYDGTVNDGTLITSGLIPNDGSWMFKPFEYSNLHTGGPFRFYVADPIVSELYSVTQGFSIADKPEYCRIRTIAGHGGTISLTGGGKRGREKQTRDFEVEIGAGQAFLIFPDENFIIDTVLINDVQLHEDYAAGESFTYRFSDVTTDHTIEAVFRPMTCTLTASAASGGSISPSGSQVVDYGTEKHYTITPDGSHTIADVTVNGVSRGAVDTLTVTADEDKTIAATFQRKQVVVQTLSGPHGSISPHGPQTVDCGTEMTFTFTPEDCHEVAEVKVNGLSRDAGESLTVMINADTTVEAGFTRRQVTVTASSGTGGSISASGTQVVDCGTLLNFTITPDNCHHISDVTVNGVSQGAVDTLSVTADKEMRVEALFRVKQFTVSGSAGTGGTISPSGGVVADCGSEQRFTVTPDMPCYKIEDVMIDQVSQGTGPIHTITVTKDQAIAASFHVRPFTITASAGTGGTISPSGTSTVECGAGRTFTITPSSCYDIKDVKVNGSSVGPVSSHTLSNITANQTISATFKVKTHTLAASAGENGSVSPAGDVSANCGSDKLFTFTPASDAYEVENVTVDGTSQGAVSSYLFTHVTASHSVHATFRLKPVITATSGEHGSLSEEGEIIVGTGTSRTFSITPASEAYEIEDVTVNSDSVGAVSFYTFTDVTADQTIHATFRQKPVITASSGDNGSLSEEGDIIVSTGDNRTFTITPASEAYEIEDVTVNGDSVGAVSIYTFTDVSENQAIHATFRQKPVITATSGENGSLSEEGDIIVSTGDNRTFTITPASEAYEIEDVTVNGDSVGPVSIYTFTDVSENQAIHATFRVKPVITASSGDNGSLSEEGDIIVSTDDSRTFTITPVSEAYEIEDVTVNGGSVGPVPNFTFTDVTADQTIHATFRLKPVITASSGDNGSLSEEGEIIVSTGDNRTFTITPVSEAYEVEDVTVNSDSVGAVSTYAFTDVTADQTIHATFRLKPVITATSGENGSLSPEGEIFISYGDDRTFTIFPAADYWLDTLTVDGEPVTPSAGYTFTDVVADHTIHATFTNDYFITDLTEPSAHAEILPAKDAGNRYQLASGESQTITITPQTGYRITNVEVDGVSQGHDITEWTFDNVTEDHGFRVETQEIPAGTYYDIEISVGENGGSEPSEALVMVSEGDDQTFEFHPESDAYCVDEVRVDGVSQGAVTTYAFSDVDMNHSVSVTFIEDPLVQGKHEIADHTSSFPESVDVSPAKLPGKESHWVSPGTDFTLTATAHPGFVITQLVADGVEQGAVTTWTFTNVNEDHWFRIDIESLGHIITATSGDNGEISPSGSVNVNEGENQTFTMNPDIGYEVDTLTVDGSSVPADTSYTFISVATEHDIHVTFRQKPVITSSSGENGSLSEEGDIIVGTGDSRTFTITPASEAYEIEDVIVNSTPLGPTSNYAFTNVTSDQTIHATFSPKPVITATSGDNGSLSSEGEIYVTSGTNRTFSITPASEAYEIQDVAVNGSSVGAVSTYTFTGVTTDQTIHATFRLKPVITATSGENGSLSEEGEIIVSTGGSRTFSITPVSEAYEVEDVTVNGSSVGAVSGYTFTDVTSDQTIHATFRLKPVITATAGENGSISPPGTVIVDYNADQTFSITPDDPVTYEIEDVTVNGSSVGAVSGYTFTDVTSDQTIHATFRLKPVITATAGENGSISPPGTVIVDYNADQTFSITTDDPVTYEIEDVTVNGSSVGAVSGYTFTDVTSDQTIHATFRLKPVITASVGDNGSISPSGSVVVSHGADQSFTMTPADGYEVEDVTVGGVSVGAVTHHTLENVTGDTAIHATFKEVTTYDLVITMTEHGKVRVEIDGVETLLTVSDTLTVESGQSIYCEIMPDTDYYASEIIKDGTYSTTNLETWFYADEEHSLDVTFSEAGTHDITVTATSNGSVEVQVNGELERTVTSATDTIQVNSGDDVYCYLTPGSGYYASDVVRDGESSSYGDFDHVLEDHTFEVTFSPTSTHDVAVNAAGGGSVEVRVNGSVVGTVTDATEIFEITSGDDIRFEITPDADHYLASILLNGEPESTWIHLGNVDTNQVLDVTFAEIVPCNFQINITGSGTVYVEVNGVETALSANGTIAMNTGDYIMYRCEPDADYYTRSLIMDGEVTDDYTYMTANGDHTLDVTFISSVIPAPYDLTVTVNGSGAVEVSIDGTSTLVTSTAVIPVNSGDSVWFNAAANAGHRIETMEADGDLFSMGGYWGTIINNVHSLDVTFVEDPAVVTYDIDTTIAGSGSVSVHVNNVEVSTLPASGIITVNEGDRVRCYFDPASGYYPVSVTADGTAVDPTSSHDFGYISENHELNVTFEAEQNHTLDVTLNGDGMVRIDVNGEPEYITSDASVEIQAGDGVYFSAKAGVGCRVDEVLKDGFASTSSGTISNMRSLDVAFVEDPSVVIYDFDITVNGSGTVSVVVNGLETDAVSTTDVVTVNEYDQVYCYFIPGLGYQLNDVVIDDVSVGAVSQKSFWTDADHTVDMILSEVGTYDITVTATSGGSVLVRSNNIVVGTVSGATEVIQVTSGDDVRCEVTPDAGYYASDVVRDGESSSYEWFGNVESDHTFEVTFSETAIHDITVTSGGSGSVTVYVNGEPERTVSNATEIIQVISGDHVQCEVTPDAGYYASSIIGSTWLWNVETDHTFEVTFSETAIHDITVTSGGSGSVVVYVNGEPERTVSGATEIIQVTSGDDVLCEVTPDADYYASSIIGSTWLWNVETDHTFEVTFSETAIHDITVTSGGSGSVTVYVNGEPERTVSNATEIIQVTSGDDVLCEVTPDADYYASDVVRDGESSSYEWFFDVDSDHDFEVTFAEIVSCELSITATDNGSVTVYVNDVESGTITNGTDTISVNSDDDVRCEFTADAGYYASAVIDGSSYNYGSSGNRYFYPVDGAHEIDVNFLPTYTITTTAGEHGTVTPTFTVNEGGNAWISIEPDEGYVIDTLRVDGTLTEPTSMYFFADVHENHTLDVTFREAVVYDIALTISGSGNIETKTDVYFDGDSISVTEGSYVTLKINADDGHKINAITVDGSAFDPTKSYRFHSVTENHSFAVTFVPGTAYEVSVVYVSEEWSEGGTINPDSIMIDEGLSQTFTANPEDGFKVLNLVVDDESLGAQASYDFTAIDSDHTIGATYASAEAVLYQISVSVAGLPNGQIYPCYGDVNVPEGEMQHFSFEPDDGYQAVVLVDGEEVDVSWWGYVFESVTADGHTVDVSFVSE